MFDDSQLPKSWNVLGACVLIIAASMITEPPGVLWGPTTAMQGSVARAYAADMELEEQLPAYLEQSNPSIDDTPPADLEPSEPEVEQETPADFEPSEPEIEQPPSADLEPSDPEVEEPEE